MTFSKRQTTYRGRAGTSPEELVDEPGKAMENEDDPEGEPGLTRPLLKLENQEKDDQIHCRIIQLRGNGLGSCLRAVNSKRKGRSRHRSVAAAIEEASNPPDDVANDEGGSRQIEETDNAELLPFAPDRGGGSTNNEPPEAG